MKREQPDSVPREPALPWGIYKKVPRRCSVCDSKEIVRDGTYLCQVHHDEFFKGRL